MPEIFPFFPHAVRSGSSSSAASSLRQNLFVETPVYANGYDVAHICQCVTAVCQEDAEADGGVGV